MTERECFIAAIVAQPADDTARLVYADWLEEHGEVAHAQFVRVQIEHAALGNSDPKSFYISDLERMRHLKDREIELLQGQDHWLKWAGKAIEDSGYLLGYPWQEQMRFRRGFICHFECSCAEFVRPGFAEALFSSQPVTSVRLTDREPYTDHRERLPFQFHREIDHDNSNDSIPHGIWDAMPGERPSGTLDWKGYLRMSDATNAVSLGCVAWGREQVGLPEWKLAVVESAGRETT